MKDFLNANKTKLAGAIVVTLGYLQLPAVQAELAKVLSPGALAISTIVLGAAVSFFGFLNNPRKE